MLHLAAPSPRCRPRLTSNVRPGVDTVTVTRGVAAKNSRTAGGRATRFARPEQQAKTQVMNGLPSHTLLPPETARGDEAVVTSRRPERGVLVGKDSGALRMPSHLLAKCTAPGVAVVPGNSAASANAAPIKPAVFTSCTENRA
jgi:hypothetical protein